MRTSRTERAFCYGSAYVFIAFLLAPIVWMVSTSFKDQLTIFQNPPVFFGSYGFTNYTQVLSDDAFVRSIGNSVVVAIGTVAATMVLAVPASFGLSRVGARLKTGLLFWILLIRAAPGMIYVIPYFLVYQSVGLIDTRLGLVVINSVFTVPLAIWILLAFFDAIPAEITEAARIDGATRLQTMVRVAIPLCAPGIASAAILVFIFSWNEFLFALTLTRFEAKTAAISILNYVAFEGTQWGKLAAAGVLILAPVLVFAVLIRKYLVQTTAGAVKG